MKIVKVVLRGPETRVEYLPDMQNGGLFVPYNTGLSVGENIGILCVAKSVSAEVFLRGTVHWVRHRGGQRRQKLHAGVGVGFQEGQEEKSGFLRRLLLHKNPPKILHRAPRIPLIPPWRSRLSSPDRETARWAEVADISVGGALVRTGGVVLREKSQVLLQPFEGASVVQQMVVAWVVSTGREIKLGLSRVRGSREASYEWTHLLNRAKVHFRSRIVN